MKQVKVYLSDEEYGRVEDERARLRPIPPLSKFVRQLIIRGLEALPNGRTRGYYKGYLKAVEALEELARDSSVSVELKEKIKRTLKEVKAFLRRNGVEK